MTFRDRAVSRHTYVSDTTIAIVTDFCAMTHATSPFGVFGDGPMLKNTTYAVRQMVDTIHANSAPGVAMPLL